MFINSFKLTGELHPNIDALSVDEEKYNDQTVNI